MIAAWKRRGWLPRWSRTQWAAVIAVPSLLYALQTPNFDVRAYLAAIGLWPAHAADGVSARDGWTVRVEARPLAGVAKNLSGLAWDPARGHLWAVVNQPTELIALDREGVVLARYPLMGFDDVEAVAWLDDGLLLVAEERRQALVAVRVPKVAGTLVRDAQRVLTLQLAPGENDGYEGLGYDREGDRLFVVKEHSPKRLFEIHGLRASLDGELALGIVDRSDWLIDASFAADLASVEYDPATGRLLLLSEASRLILELDGAGGLTNVHSLRRGNGGLASSVPQAEGIALDGQGGLYLVSEPNLFYAFARP